MKYKICIIITSQFGYHSDTFFYCKHLNKNLFEVHYIGFDNKLPRQKIPATEVNYIAVKKNKVLRYIHYLLQVSLILRKEKYNLLFIVDCQGSLLIRLLNLSRKSIFDVRTGDINHRNNSFSWFNFKIKLSSLLYKSVTIISESLSAKLKISKKKVHILPLGGNKISIKKKKFSALKLLYVGSLNGRNIHETVEGISLFQHQNINTKIEYHIIGFGNSKNVNRLINTINNHKLQNIVFFHGEKFHDELIPYLENCNIGVVYVPIHQGYTFQPSTKLFEYGLCGMPMLATSTFENIRYITPETGVLIKDTPCSFAEGLEKLIKNKSHYDSDTIKFTYESNTWENIVKSNLEPYLLNALCN